MASSHQTRPFQNPISIFSLFDWTSAEVNHVLMNFYAPGMVRHPYSYGRRQELLGTLRPEEQSDHLQELLDVFSQMLRQWPVKIGAQRRPNMSPLSVTLVEQLRLKSSCIDCPERVPETNGARMSDHFSITSPSKP